MNLADIDADLALELLRLYRGPAEGALFGGDSRTLEAIFTSGAACSWSPAACRAGRGPAMDRLRLLLDQVEFLGNVLAPLRPRHIVEVGTHCGHFCLLIGTAFPDVAIDTFGIEPSSGLCVDLLRQRLGDRFTFHQGDSRVTFSAFAPSSPIDFAWIDGGHSFELAAADLANCARLNIPEVCVDDVNHPPVREAAEWFCVDSGYRVVGRSSDVGAHPWRGVWHLVRRLDPAAAGSGRSTPG